MNRFRLELDQSLYAPSYAVLLGAFLASAMAQTFVTDPGIAAVNRTAIGTLFALTGLHFVIYRHAHHHLLADRLHLARYSAPLVAVIGVVAILVGITFAVFGYIALRQA